MVAPPIGIKLGILAELDAAVAASGYEGTKFFVEFVPTDDDPSSVSAAANSDGDGNDAYQHGSDPTQHIMYDSTGVNTTDPLHKALRWPSGSIAWGNQSGVIANGLTHYITNSGWATTNQSWLGPWPASLCLGGDHNDDQPFIMTAAYQGYYSTSASKWGGNGTYDQVGWTDSGSVLGSGNWNSWPTTGHQFSANTSGQVPDNIKGPPSSSAKAAGQHPSTRNLHLSVGDQWIATTHPLKTPLGYNRDFNYHTNAASWYVWGQSTNPWTGNAWAAADFQGKFQWGQGNYNGYSRASAMSKVLMAYFEPVPRETDYDDNDGTVANAPFGFGQLYSASLDDLGNVITTIPDDGELGGSNGYPVTLAERPRLGSVPDDAVIQYVAFMSAKFHFSGGVKNKTHKGGTAAWSMYVMFTSESGGAGT